MAVTDPLSTRVDLIETGVRARSLESIRAGLLWLQAVEIVVVRHQARFGQRGFVRQIVVGVNWLGNGLLYPSVAAALLWVQGPQAVRVVSVVGVALGLAHLIYPWIKRRVARGRPCDTEPGLPSSLRALDEYSFPSGHCMTTTVVAIPITTAFPDLAAPAAVLWVLVLWERLASAHHYPSDLVAGTVLGVACAWPITSMLL